jgi:hypothetical protein
MKKHSKLGATLNILLLLLIGMIIGTAITLYKQKTLVSYFRQANQSKYLKFDLIDELLASEYLDPQALS